MNTTTFSPIHTADMQDLDALFASLQKPYGAGEIVRFNLAYQRLYPLLSRSEKRNAERLVDALLDNLQDQRLAPRIYGVV